jgi:hypothetical protein
MFAKLPILSKTLATKLALEGFDTAMGVDVVF